MDPDLPPPPSSSSSSSSSSKVNDPFLARAQKFGLKTDVNVTDLPPAPTGYQGRTTTTTAKPDAKSLVAQIKSSASASAAAIAANPKLAGGPPPAGGSKSPVVTSTSTYSSSSPKIEPLNGTSAVVKANPFARASHAATTSPLKSTSPSYTSSTPSKSITSTMASSSLHDDHDDDDPPPAAPDDDDDDRQNTSPRGLTGLGMAKGGVTAGSSDIKPFAYAGNSIKGVVLKKTNRDLYEKPVPETRAATIQTSSGAKNISKFTTKTAAESEASPIPEPHRAKDPLYSTPLPIDKTTGGALFSWREAAPAKQALGTCDKCGEEIMDRMLDALGQTFHAECFVCVVCRKTLAGDVLTVNDNYYHPSCMTCTVCSTQLSSQQFTVHPDTQELYCVKHARQAVAPQGAGPDGRMQCGFCHESILPGQEIVKELSGTSYHAACMNCAHCKAPLAGRRCFTHNGKQYCEVDYNDLFSTSCHHCMKVIEGSCMQIEDEMNKKYTFHPGCFVCHQCRTNLRGQSFYVDRGRVLCEKDYTEVTESS